MRHSDWESYQDHDDRRLHVYGPDQWHGETFVVGNREALLALRDALDEALETGSGLALAYAADGEGFSCGVLLVEDEEVWAEVVLPYHSDLARDRREVEEVLAPTVRGLTGGPEVRLVRWRRYHPERAVRLSEGVNSLAEPDQARLAELVSAATGLDQAAAADVVTRLGTGSRPVVMATTRAEAESLVTAVAAFGVAAEFMSS